MKCSLIVFTTLFICSLLAMPVANAARIKDLAQLHGVRNNQLLGYGIITGLNGTGDDMSKSAFTLQAVYNMMTRQGITVNPDSMTSIKLKNVATVMVTATLPPFAKSGSTVDVQVSSIGDSKSLAGGTLLMTPLLGPDGKVYAVAQGSLSTGSFAFGGKAAQVQKNHPTVGTISGGAIIERSVAGELGAGGKLEYQMNSADFTTAANLAEGINKRFGQDTAFPDTSGTVKVTIPDEFKEDIVDFIAAVEILEVETDSPARVVVNERTGTVVMGKDVKLSTVAVSHGNLSLIIRDDVTVSQPNPLSAGQTVIAPKTTAKVVEDTGQLVLLDMNKGVSIGEIANALNAIGATPRDLIAIFQAIKAAGSLHGELIII